MVVVVISKLEIDGSSPRPLETKDSTWFSSSSVGGSSASIDKTTKMVCVSAVDGLIDGELVDGLAVGALLTVGERIGAFDGLANGASEAIHQKLVAFE